MAQDQQLKIRLDVLDNATKALKNVQEQLKGITKETEGTTKSFFTLRKAIIAIATGSALRAVINQTKKFEDLQTILSRVTGSLKDGTQVLNYLIEFTNKSTFSVEDLANAYILLANSGITPTERLLKVFTDTASASTDQISTLNDLTKLFAKGVQGGLGLQTLTQLTAKGIPVFKILEDQLGLTKDGITDFASTTSGANKILDALVAGLEKSFSGATQARAGNLSTSVSKLSKELDLMLITIGQEGLTKSVSDLADALSKLREEESPLLKFFGSITSAMTDALDWVCHVE
jgi:phage tail tape-measure protein